MAIKHVIFDIDGTLIDTKAAFLGALEHALGQKGVSHGDLTPYFSLPLADAVRDFGITPKEFEAWNRDYAERLSRAPLYAGVREMIESLASLARLAVVTSRKHEIAHIGLQEAGLLGRFDCLIAADDVVHPKPAPDPLDKYASDAGCGKDEMAFVGDSVHDAACARNAGVRFFAPGWATIADELAPFAVTTDELVACVRQSANRKENG